MCELTDMQMAAARMLGSNVSAPMGGAILENPQIRPAQIILKGTAAGGSTYFYMDDADGLASAIGTVGAGGVEMVSQTAVPLSKIKEFLKTYALIICGYNFQSSDPAQLSNNISLITSTIDGNQKTNTIFSSQSISNQQQNPNLLNVNQPLVLTNTTAIKVPALTDGTTYTFTFKILTAVPYGDLDQFLKDAKIPAVVSC